MTERIIPSDVISFVEELRKDRANNAEFWYGRANKATNDQQYLINMVNSNAMANLAIVYRMVKYTMEAVNKTDSLIEKLEEKSADKEEVRALRKEFVGKVNQTLTPIKEEIEKQRERNKRNNNVGIQ